MRHTIVSYTMKPGREPENAALLGAVFEELAQARPAGFRYAVFHASDSGEFVHLYADQGAATAHAGPSQSRLPGLELGTPSLRVKTSLSTPEKLPRTRSCKTAAWLGLRERAEPWPRCPLIVPSGRPLSRVARARSWLRLLHKAVCENLGRARCDGR
jgi:hypothetical protein